MTLNSLNADITVVGAGLVGALTGLLLAQRQPQLKIAILEAAADATSYNANAFDPRVVALTQASVDLLESIGIWQKLKSARVCAYSEMEVWDAEGTGRIHFSAQEVGREALGYIVENSLAVSHLQQALSYAPNVQWYLNEKVASVALPSLSKDDSFGDSELVLQSGKLLRTKLMLAADGAQSTLRKLANIRTREWEYGHSAIVTTIRTELPHEFVARQRFMVEGPLAFLPLQQSSAANVKEFHCSIVWSTQHEKAEQLMALNDQEFCRQLTLDSESCLGRVEQVDRRFSINLVQRHAVDYCVPGLALLGDAAHTIHPLAGQGVNIGIQDVIAIVAEIDRAIKRDLPLGQMATLRRYQRARKASNLAMMAGMEGFKRLFGSRSLLLRWLRNEGVRQVNRIDSLKKIIVNRVVGG